MKISTNWLNDHIDISISNEKLADGLTSLGLEAYFTTIKPSFTGVVLGKIVECKNHSNSDHLHICKVQVDDNKFIQVICGAPNVRNGIYVPIALVGAKLLNGKFKIKKSKIRGELSEGMICSGKELGINNDSSGIMIVEDSNNIGESFDTVIDFENDTVFDIDLTPNRGDCFGHLGISREISLFTNQKVKFINDFNLRFINNDINININEKSICMRYIAVTISDIEVSDSPDWLKSRLSSIGQSSINNIVDATNYIQFDLGHPMHAFDSDLIDGSQINVRYAKKNEEILCLDGELRKLDLDSLVIADKIKPLAIAGIIGGSNSCVSNDTTSVTLECAYFDPISIRKTSKRLGISTESSKRFERNTDYQMMEYAIKKLARLILDISGGQISSKFVDINFFNNKKKEVEFNVENCNNFLGTSLKSKEVKKIFNSLNIDCSQGVHSFKCSIPSYRNDISYEHDLTEEIARVYGYENINNSLSFTIPVSSIKKDIDYVRSIRSYFSANGFNEHISNSLVSNNELYFYNDGPVELSNPLSNDMKFMRNSILPGLFKAANYNQKRQQSVFKIFEVGAVHSINDGIVEEKINLGFVFSKSVKKHWKDNKNIDIHIVMSEIEKFFSFIHLEVDFNDEKELVIISSNNNNIGFLSDSISNRNIKLKEDLFYCELYLDGIINSIKYKKISFNKHTYYPSINRDIAVQVDSNIKAGLLIESIKKNGTDLLSSVSIFDLYQSNELKDNSKSIAFCLEFQSKEKTLTDNEVDSTVKKIINNLVKQFDAVQR